MPSSVKFPINHLGDQSGNDLKDKIHPVMSILSSMDLLWHQMNCSGSCFRSMEREISPDSWTVWHFPLNVRLFSTSPEPGKTNSTINKQRYLLIVV